MANRYSKQLGGKLKELIEELEKESKDEALNLKSEVELSRALLGRTLAMVTLCDENSEKLEVETVYKGLALAKETLAHVVTCVEKMAKVELLKKDKISVNNLDWIMEHVIRIVDDVVKPLNAEAAKQIVKRIEDIKLLDNNTPRVIIGIQ